MALKLNAQHRAILEAVASGNATLKRVRYKQAQIDTLRGAGFLSQDRIVSEVRYDITEKGAEWLTASDC